MEIKAFINILLKRIWIVLLITIAIGLLSTYYNYYMLKPIYNANTTLYIINKSSDDKNGMIYSDFLIGDQLVKDYTELIKSRSVTNSVISDLGLTDTTPELLSSEISVNAKNDTRIIEISAIDTDPDTAMKIANSVAKVFSQKVVLLMHAENVNVVDVAERPTIPIGPRPVRNITIAVISALLLSVGLVFLIDYMDNTIKTVEDIDKHLGLTVIGTIPDHRLK